MNILTVNLLFSTLVFGIAAKLYLIPKLPARLAAGLERCLSKDRDARPGQLDAHGLPAEHHLDGRRRERDRGREKRPVAPRRGLRDNSDSSCARCAPVRASGRRTPAPAS